MEVGMSAMVDYLCALMREKERKGGRVKVMRKEQKRKQRKKKRKKKVVVGKGLGRVCEQYARGGFGRGERACDKQRQ